MANDIFGICRCQWSHKLAGRIGEAAFLDDLDSENGDSYCLENFLPPIIGNMASFVAIFVLPGGGSGTFVYKYCKLYFVDLYMFVTQIQQNQRLPVVVENLVADDYKKVTRSEFFFNWKLEKGHAVFKLVQKGGTDILGLMSVEFFDAELRVEIRLLAVGKQNVGAAKLIGRIAGCLFAYAARLAVTKYGGQAAISLVPKTELGQHYMSKYGFEQAGRHLFLEGKLLLKLLKTYDYD